MKRGERILLVFLFAGLFKAPLPACADNVKNFYNHNSARTVFAEDAVATDTPELGFFEQKSTKSKVKKESVSTERTSVAAKSLKSEMPKSKDEILNSFGDPDKDVSIPGRDDAPTPFKAMMASLELGDTDLAQRYAKQYVKYLQSVQTKTDTVMALVNRAMANEGMIKIEEVKDNQSDPRIHEDQFDEQQARSDVRLALKDKVPLDPFGEVDVYFFFKMDEQNSRLMLPEIEAFYTAIKDNPKIRFVALTLDNASREDIKEYSDTYGIKFPIRGGVSLARKLNVTGVPAVLAMTHNAPQKVVVEKGFRRSFYLEELTNLMIGKGA